MLPEIQVECVYINEDDSGELQLKGNTSRLKFNTAPHEITALNGLYVWIYNDRQICLGDIIIAEIIAVNKILFKSREVFLDAVKQYHEGQRERGQTL